MCVCVEWGGGCNLKTRVGLGGVSLLRQVKDCEGESNCMTQQLQFTRFYSYSSFVS